MRTVRENLEDLLDAGSFIELGSLVVAAQRRRRSLDDLIHHTPADGVITGFGKVSHARFPSAAKVAVIAYDYTVLAGTQGKLNHDKQDRLLDICYKTRTPLLLLAEGGGGRPGDVDVVTAGSLHIKTFSKFAMLSGLVPVIGIIAGRCFAGNAVLLGCCDVIIATKNSNIGMAGPAMIEGGGLGRFAADDIGPSPVQEANGVIDIIAEDESQAIALAKRYLGYFQGNESAWQYASQSKLADSLPRDRLRVYDMRLLIEHLIDDDSGLELRSKFAPNIITMLARIEGKPIGLIANNPGRLGGAIDANAADKAARFVQLCNAHGLPIISLIDTPGNMVGPQAEAQALVRHCCRLFVAGAKVTVPWVSIVIRKAYGLGAMAMAAGSFHDSLLSVAWPQAEFGGMGLEGAVRLGFKRELESLSSDQEREALFQSKFDEMMEQGKAISAAMLFEIDAVIDPDATREWILGALEVAGAFEPHGFLEPAGSLKMAGSYTKGSASRTMASNGLSARFIDTW
jgi:acetyl-CoA carboxylase carboxyltransferase component